MLKVFWYEPIVPATLGLLISLYIGVPWGTEELGQCQAALAKAEGAAKIDLKVHAAAVLEDVRATRAAFEKRMRDSHYVFFMTIYRKELSPVLWAYGWKAGELRYLEQWLNVNIIFQHAGQGKGGDNE